ncbi:hypothetical protein [Catenulispora rubra]|uniref:hypothetical protein n=1 Tax=Catenulispora rubra TaxID=280293 RepID=UPI001892474E|nr:hypothetical protein [Catenulispora rubra]
MNTTFEFVETIAVGDGLGLGDGLGPGPGLGLGLRLGLGLGDGLELEFTLAPDVGLGDRFELATAEGSCWISATTMVAIAVTMTPSSAKIAGPSHVRPAFVPSPPPRAGLATSVEPDSFFSGAWSSVVDSPFDGWPDLGEIRERNSMYTTVSGFFIRRAAAAKSLHTQQQSRDSAVGDLADLIDEPAGHSDE